MVRECDERKKGEGIEETIYGEMSMSLSQPDRLKSTQLKLN